MKPKNKYQENVLNLSHKLPSVSEKQKQWAYEHCFDKIGLYTKNQVWCLCCGEVYQRRDGMSEAKRYTVCPKCGKRIELIFSRKRTLEEERYFLILNTSKGFQVCRHFLVRKKAYKIQVEGCTKINFTINEVQQNWIDEKGKETLIKRSRMYHSFGGYYWDFGRPMELRGRESNMYNRIFLHSDAIYPYKNILPKIKRNGYVGRRNSLPVSELFKMLLTDREAEMLKKNNQNSLLEYKWRRDVSEFSMPFFHSIKIANRNKYIVKDASMWYDYLRLLEYFNLDTHNAKYVCIPNMAEEHDRLLAKMKRIEEKKELEKKIAEAKKWEKEYKEEKERFFDICFGDDEIEITAIKSVAEMAEEGQVMHHCVYSMGYFRKPESLILTAKNKEGERIETIEIDLNTFKVVQSRGRYNSVTDKHDKILKLVEANISAIKVVA